MQWIKLREKPDLLEQAASWFSGHWNIDEEEYRSSAGFLSGMQCWMIRETSLPGQA